MINEKNAVECGALTYPLCEKTAGVDVSGDFTLPDYQSEIRRVLHVFPTVLPPAKYVSGDTVEMSGNVDYLLLYIGGDGGMYSAPLSSQYNFSLPLEARGEKGEDVFCNITVENVSARVTAPRRLTLRSRLSSNVRVYAHAPTDVQIGEGAPIESIYKQSQSCNVLEGESGSSDMIDISYIVPSVSEDTRVVLANGTVKITDTVARDMRLECRGDVAISLLCVSEDSGEYSTLEGLIPFEGDIDMPKCREDCSAWASGVVAQMAVNVTDAGIECNAGIILCGTCMCDKMSEYTSDVYSVSNQCSCEQRSISTRHLVACDNVNFSVSERLPLSEVGIPADADIIYCTASAAMDNCSRADGKCLLGGRCIFTVVYKKDGEIGCTDVSIPVSFRASTDGEDIASFGAMACVAQTKARISDGNLCLDGEVLMGRDCLGETAVSAALRVSFGEAVEAKVSEIVVCYPEAGDTLWSVAKKYKVAPSAVMGAPETDKYITVEY